jgi:hypothetical protein
MEEWRGCTGQENTNAPDGRNIDILCDHQDQRGNCCNRIAEVRIEYAEDELSFYTCKSCFHSYYNHEDKAYML